MATAFALACLSVRAVPASTKAFVYTQPDGTKITLTKAGDEYGHIYLDENNTRVVIGADGYARRTGVKAAEAMQLMKQRRTESPLMRNLRNAPKAKAPTTGNVKGLIVLVSFSDNAFTNTRDEVHKLMNQEGYNYNGATGSARDYFISQSSGVFSPTFDVVGPVTLQFPTRYYGGNLPNGSDRNAGTMIFAAVQAASRQGLANLADYDLDGDGIADMVYIIYAGKGEADGGSEDTVWPHMSSLQGDPQFAYQEIGGKRIGLYACSAEQRGDGTFSGIGTFCHEYGHCLGLPDIYDVSYSGGYGMGRFDIMSQGSYLNNGNTPPNYSGFERASLGWLQYKEADRAQHVALAPIGTGNTAYRLSSANPNEYFVLENRQMEGWDTYLPTRGLLITHIDYDRNAWDNNAVNTDPDHQRVKLMAADNVWNYSTMTGDLYPGLLNNTSFTDTSIPSSRLWDGSLLGKPVTNIAMSGNTVSFDIDVNSSGIGHISADSESDVSLYTTTGTLVGKGKAAEVCRNIRHGEIYIMKAEGKTRKVAF